MDKSIPSGFIFSEMGYAAAGSFTGFLIETYGMINFLKIWNLNKNWETVFNKKLYQMESDWHNWLTGQFSEQ